MPVLSCCTTQDLLFEIVDSSRWDFGAGGFSQVRCIANRVASAMLHIRPATEARYTRPRADLLDAPLLLDHVIGLAHHTRPDRFARHVRPRVLLRQVSHREPCLREGLLRNPRPLAVFRPGRNQHTAIDWSYRQGGDTFTARAETRT